jgi:hypothetical protein
MLKRMIYVIIALVCFIIFLFGFIGFMRMKLNKAIHLGEKATKLATEYQNICCMYAANYYYLRRYIGSAQIDNKYWRDELDNAVKRCQDDIKKYGTTYCCSCHKEN